MNDSQEEVLSQRILWREGTHDHCFILRKESGRKGDVQWTMVFEESREDRTESDERRNAPY